MNASHRARKSAGSGCRDCSRFTNPKLAQSTASGAQRLARLLLDLAERHGRGDGEQVIIALPLSQEELASLVSASRATVTRAFSSWRRRGVVQTGQHLVTITDLAALRQIAAAGR